MMCSQSFKRRKWRISILALQKYFNALLLLNMTNELNEYIRIAWQQIREAAKNQDWPGMEQAFRRMATLQQLDEQSRDLQRRIAGFSNEISPNGQPPHFPQAPFTLDDHVESTRRGTTRPRELRIGTYRAPITLNNQILIATANWILKQGKTLPTIHNFVHPTNSGFGASAQIKRLEDGSFIEIGESQVRLIERARKLLDACGFRDLRIEILLEDGTLKTA
jgi:hypothetical protein